MTHDDDNFHKRGIRIARAVNAMDELLGRGLNRSAGRARSHCVLRWGQDVPSFPHAPFLAPALFLHCASGSFSLTKSNTSCTSSCQRRYAPMMHRVGTCHADPLVHI